MADTNPPSISPAEEHARRRTYLSNTPFFGGLDDDALDRVLAMCKASSVPAGLTVFEEGDSGRSMFILESGTVMMLRAGAGGHQVRLVRLKAGDFFGETTLIEMQPRPCTALVESDAQLLELSNRALLQLYREDVRTYVLVLQNINRELCRRLRKADDRITEYASATQDDRTQIRRIPAPHDADDDDDPDAGEH